MNAHERWIILDFLCTKSCDLQTIMIGSEYQASVPSGLSPYENSQTMPYENEDKLLWTPFIVADGPTEEYLQTCTQLQQQLMQSRIAATTASQPLQALALLASLPLGAHTRDDEQVIPLLHSFSNLWIVLRRSRLMVEFDQDFQRRLS